MKALVLADVHGVNVPLPWGSCDIIISCGDLPLELIDELTRAGVPFFGVVGNHDYYDLPPKHNLHRSVKEYGGLRFGGFEGSCRYKPVGHHLYDDFHVAVAMAEFPPVDVFVAHSAPAGIHDEPDDVHCGFAGFNTYIREKRPRLFLHGHVHRNVESELDGTRILSVFGAQVVNLPESE